MRCVRCVCCAPIFISSTSSLPCSSATDAATLRNYITTYAAHPNQLIYNGRVFASTFSGESCMFGQSSVQSGWSTQFLQQLSGTNAVYFVPAFFIQPSAFSGFAGVTNGIFNVRVIRAAPSIIHIPSIQWNSGWPTELTSSSVSNYGSSALEALAPYIGNTTIDEQYINALTPLGESYMAAVSPWFFTHYSPQTYNKNVSYLSPAADQF